MKEISKKFGSQIILKDLTLEIKAGEFHVLLGPSGEGKTTILKIIAGLISPDKGQVIFNNIVMNKIPPQKRKIGFLFQDFALFPHLNVYENIAFPLKTRGIRKTKIKKLVDKYLTLFKLNKHKYKYPHQLSGGEKQKVALARALIFSPKVLLLDEPLSHLDAWQRDELRKELKQIQTSTKITTIYVTHDQSDAIELADKISIIHKGRIEQTGKIEEIFYHPKSKFIASFIGIKNIFKGKVLKYNHKNIVKIYEKCLTKELNLIINTYNSFEKGQKVYLCIHPENVLIEKQAKDENCFRGHIRELINQGPIICAILDINGLKVYSFITKEKQNELKLEKNRSIWVYLPKEHLIIYNHTIDI